LMIKPVQRLMKYQLILKDCLKYNEKLEKTQEVLLLKSAVELMIRTPQAANDMMLVASVKPYVDPYRTDGKNTNPKPIDFNKQGKLVHQSLVRFKMFNNSGGGTRLASASHAATPNLARKTSNKPFKKTFSSATFFNDEEQQVLISGRIFVFEQCLVLATQCDQRTERLGFNCEFVIRAPDLQIIPKCKHTTLPGFSVKNRRHWKGSSEANKECFFYCDKEEDVPELQSFVNKIVSTSDNFIMALADPKRQFGM